MDAVRAKAREAAGELEVTQLEAGTYADSELLMAASPSLFGESRLVEVHGLEPMSEHDSWGHEDRNPQTRFAHDITGLPMCPASPIGALVARLNGGVLADRPALGLSSSHRCWFRR